MKTIKIIPVLSLALIFATVNAAFSGTIKPGSTEPTVKNIKYQVNVHLASDLNLCNTYLIQVVDENGLLVAPPQTFVPGISSYTFISLPQAIGILRPIGWKTKRTAMLISAGSPEIDCSVDLVTRPDSKFGTFISGQTYYFNLFPDKMGRKTASEPKAKD